MDGLKAKAAGATGMRGMQTGSLPYMQLELQKQTEINRRLNDLLNSKDDEILQLSHQVMNLQTEVGKLRENKGSPVRSSPAKLNSGRKGSNAGYMPSNYSAVTSLEHRLQDSERHNKELQKEIRLLQKIQNHQGNALEKMNDAEVNEQKITAVLNDLRVQKEQNKKLKQQIADYERQNKSTHNNMMRLEDTIKEMKAAALEQKKQYARSKQNERVSACPAPNSACLRAAERSHGENRRAHAGERLPQPGEGERSQTQRQAEAAVRTPDGGSPQPHRLPAGRAPAERRAVPRLTPWQSVPPLFLPYELALESRARLRVASLILPRSARRRLN